MFLMKTNSDMACSEILAGFLADCLKISIKLAEKYTGYGS